MILIKGKKSVICNVSEIFVFRKIIHPGNALLLMGSLNCIWNFQWHNLLTLHFPPIFLAPKPMNLAPKPNFLSIFNVLDY